MVEEYVIRNEKAIINIFESGELEREEKEDVKESGWDCVTKIMLYYFRKYIPNVLCTSLIWVIGEENRRIPFS